MSQLSHLERSARWLPAAGGIFAIAALGVWLQTTSPSRLDLRVPGTDASPGQTTDPAAQNPVLRGTLIPGEGKPADLVGYWPRFRGPNQDGISPESIALAREWGAGQPKPRWAIDVGEGYAGAAVRDGRVYLMDYDREKKQDALRCLSLADGREIWRFTYPVAIKRNHGITRTVPTLTSNLVVAIGPKCHVVCLEALTGKLKWGIDMVRQFGTTVPEWYTGQCPLVEEDRLILAPGGKDALFAAIDLETGKTLWQTPNPRGWKMTHSSVVPMVFNGQRQYLYCANAGVVAASAKDGSLLWDTPDWKISLATVPSPVVLEGGRIFLTGGYNAGSLMLQVKEDGGKLGVQTLYRLKPEVFGATQHSPILYQGNLYGTRADGKFVCLSPEGTVTWASDRESNFGLGSFMIAGGLIFALNDSGTLTLMEATPAAYRPLAQARVLTGHDSWGPMAMVGGHLIARDLNRMVCLDVARR